MSVRGRLIRGVAVCWAALGMLVACAGDPDVAADASGAPDRGPDIAADPDLAEVDLATDSPPDEAAASDLADEPVLPPFQRDYPPAADFPAPPGFLWRRAIIHLHSTHSHDACDGNPRLAGEAYNEPCLASLRAALCLDRIDFAFLTDHRDLMAETPFDDLLLHAPATDTLIEVGGTAVGNRIGCPDGFTVTTTAGMEGSDRLMPLAFEGHLDEDVAVRSELLGREDAAAIAAQRAGGALIWAAHTEQSSAAEIRERGYDGIEIYNLHANLAPDLREFLGLEPTAGLEELLHFQLRQSDTPPDLALLGFLEPNPPALRAWAEILQERPLVGVGGTDAHENVLATPLVDGERFDSYRRMMAWFSNYLLAEDDGLAAARDALLAGRVFLAFDTIASPAGFDCALHTAAGSRLEMGATTTFADGLELRVVTPAIDAPWAGPVAVRTLLLRATDAGWETVAEAGSGEIAWPIAEAGVYRVEVRAVPSHYAPYLDPRLARLAERELGWIYGNPFRILP